MSDGKTVLQLRSLLKKSGELEISLASVPTPEPAEDEVVVRVEASPINPSDLGLLVGAADMTTAKASGTKDAPVITAKVPDAAMKAMAGRLDESMPVGNEGAGVVVATGSSDAELHAMQHRDACFEVMIRLVEREIARGAARDVDDSYTEVRVAEHR